MNRRKLILAMIITAIVCTSTQGKYGGGSGTEQDPYQIWDANHMQAIGTDANDWDKCFILMDDVDLSVFDGNDGRPEFNVIGYWISNDDKKGFSGIFDGNSHKILNFTLNTMDSKATGFFAWTEENSEIKNMGFVNANVEYGGITYGAGIITGKLEGTMSNCFTSGSVSGYMGVGGLAGGLGGTGIIYRCYSSASVKGESVVGGLVGFASGVISRSHSIGDVSGDSTVGGLAGQVEVDRTIDNCYAMGDVSGNTGIGGLVGYNFGQITYCYATGLVEGTGAGVSGLVGDDYGFGVITDSYWNTETSGIETGTDGIGCTTAQMHQQSTFTNWDFINVWNIGENQTYPYLRTVSPGDINKDHITNFFDLGIICNQWLKEP